jgi:hypothetical protein
MRRSRRRRAAAPRPRRLGVSFLNPWSVLGRAQAAVRGVMLVCLGVRAATQPLVQVVAAEPTNFCRVQRSRAMKGEAAVSRLLHCSPPARFTSHHTHLPPDCAQLSLS